jgi:hydrogenase nickel incorporation protein HypA/HybF
MHELAICQALIEQLQGVARERGAHRVLRAVVRIGPLAGVEPQLLAHAYSIASAGTIAEGSELTLEICEVRVRCERCGAESEVSGNRLVCAACGDWRTTVMSGDELLLARVELQTRERLAQTV